jgi:hypothetical protein
MDRLKGCPTVYELSKPPVHAKLSWHSPSQLQVISLDPEKGKPGFFRATIQFAVSYEQSDFFNTDEEAQSSTASQQLFFLWRRNVYLISDSSIQLFQREYRDGAKWVDAGELVPKFSCWQTLPNP